MRHFLTDDCEIMEFNSIQDLHDYALVTEVGGSGATKSHSIDLNFFKYSWDDAVKWALYGGCPEYEKVNILIDKIKTSEAYEQIAEPYKTDEPSGAIDITAVLQGEPECFIDWTVQQQSKPVLRIALHQSMAGGVKTYCIENRGVAIISMLDTLLKSYTLDLHIITANISSGKSMRTAMRRPYFITDLKLDTSNELCRNTLVFCAVNPCYNRRFKFAVMETVWQAPQCFGEYYGKTVGLPEDEKKKFDIYIPHIEYGEYKSLEEAQSRIQTIVNQAIRKQARG